MKLLVGLGNPGPEYARTRHNAGFMAVDRFVDLHRIASEKRRFQGVLRDGWVGSERVLVLKPMTYMNRSGASVGEAMRFYRLPVGELLVVVDDTALPLGAVRLRPGGSSGGHNGLEDLARVLGGGEFARLRVGIGGTGAARSASRRDYVLGRFSAEEEQALGPALDRAAEAAACWVAEGLEPAMTRFNRKVEAPEGGPQASGSGAENRRSEG